MRSQPLGAEGRYGYGAGELWALPWALLFVAIGTIVARYNGSRWPDGERPGFWYSLDRFLFGIRLSERYYFYVHRFAGCILVFLMLEGLTGLTELTEP